MKSIIQAKKQCYICGNTQGLDCHHIFGGNPGRKNSEKCGLKVWLCNDFTTNRCHKNVHERDRNLMDYLHREGQKAFEEIHGSREDFVRIFGRNYL